MPRSQPASPKLLTGTAARAQFRGFLHGWFLENGRDLPWRHTRDPYAIMVSEFMLQQTQVATVIPYFERWLARFPSFGGTRGCWGGRGARGLGGLATTPARNLRRAAQPRADVRGVLPPHLESIAALARRRYTAAADRQLCPSIFRSSEAVEAIHRTRARADADHYDIVRSSSAGGLSASGSSC
jgi:A/G-specific adenine glycosylase